MWDDRCLQRSFRCSKNLGVQRQIFKVLKKLEQQGPVNGRRHDYRVYRCILHPLLQMLFLDDPAVVFSTISVGGRRCFDSIPFSAVVIDEAGMVPEAHSMIVLRSCVQRVVLVGDPQQLKATVFSKANVAALYDRSLMARLMEVGFPVHMLVVEYRMGEGRCGVVGRESMQMKCKFVVEEGLAV